MRYAYTIYYVADVTTTIMFYERAFGFSRKFITPEGDYGELDTGATALAFASVKLGKSNFKKGFSPLTPKGSPAGVEIAFVSDDIATEFQRAVDAGATIWTRSHQALGPAGRISKRSQWNFDRDMYACEGRGLSIKVMKLHSDRMTRRP